MKLFTASQIRAWDRYTIECEPISSIDLMERAAAACTSWLLARKLNVPYTIFCGKGNNGGDGLAIARMLLQHSQRVTVYILDSGKKGTDDFEKNLERLRTTANSRIIFLRPEESFPELTGNEIIIDALFGSGLNKPLSGFVAGLIDYLNQRRQSIISIDVPSGLYIDQSSVGNTIIHATHVLTFQINKEGFLQAENARYIGHVHVLDIGLDQSYADNETAQKELIDEPLIRAIFKPRLPFAHKGTYGHALLAAGSYGKMGACVLAATSCLRAGVGLLSCLIPKCGYAIVQTAVPEAMVMTDHEQDMLTQLPDGIDRYAAIGIGPGIGMSDATQKLVGYVLRRFPKPIVLDADGLNCLSVNKDWLPHIPPGSILTPHPKEFERLFGATSNDFERVELALAKAKEYNIIIVVKGHHTFIATSGGRGYYNNTGNAGMAKGGSGDVLTGILTSLLAQGYDQVAAAILGVYLHGLAGDIAARDLSMESMIASDITTHLPQAFLTLNK